MVGGGLSEEMKSGLTNDVNGGEWWGWGREVGSAGVGGGKGRKGIQL